MNKTNIEYLSHSWNPLAMRCAPVSEGCKNCWHLSLVKRLAKNPMIPKDRQKAYAGGPPVLIEKELNAPLKLKKPAIIGVQFMGDLFHGNVEWLTIDKILLQACHVADYHTYIILTKRIEAAWFYFNSPHRSELLTSNIWLGVTAENQEMADKRIPILLQIPAAVRFVSCEPLLGNIDFSHLPESGAELDWVIVGGESGPGARPMHPDWVRSIRDQCQSAGVPLPFFFKQWGEWSPITWMLDGGYKKERSVKGKKGGDNNLPGYRRLMSRVGKKKAGRILDGRIWDEYPNIS